MSLAGYSPCGHKDLGAAECVCARAHTYTHTHTHTHTHTRIYLKVTLIVICDLMEKKQHETRLQWKVFFYILFVFAKEDVKRKKKVRK